MIFDHIDHAARYEALGPRFQKAFAYLRSQDLAQLPLGRHEIEGKDLLVLVQAYSTKPESEGFWEAHRRYIDLQYIVSGRERIGFGRGDTMSLASHDETRDLSVLHGEGYFATLEAGCFMVLWPQDAHMPGLFVDQPEAVRKLVFKIAVD